MEYHLTLHTLILGSLAWSLSILALAWLIDLWKRFAAGASRPQDSARSVPSRPAAAPAAAPDVGTWPITSMPGRSPAAPAEISQWEETSAELVAAGAPET
jgi:hypothetical protein